MSGVDGVDGMDGMDGVDGVDGVDGARVYRVDWTPGTDMLRGRCHCGAERLSDDPVQLWEWMLDHPRGHRPTDRTSGGATP